MSDERFGRTTRRRTRQGGVPPLAEDEQVVLHQQGAYLSRRSWKLGNLFLTDRRFLFSPPGPTGPTGPKTRLTLDIPLGNVTRLASVKRPYILVSKTCLSFSYRDGKSGRSRQATIITANLDAWTQRLAEVLTSLGVDFEGPERLADSNAASKPPPRGQADVNRRIGLEDLERVAAALDPVSAELIWYLWEHRHAKIEALRQVTGAASHMHVLARIREIVNPTARRLLGRALLVFEPRRADTWTGEIAPFSWWLCREAERQLEVAPPADVFDEGEQVVIVMELAGVEENEDVQVRVRGKQVTVNAANGSSWEIPLSATVDEKPIATYYHNGVLQVRLSKKGERP